MIEIECPICYSISELKNITLENVLGEEKKVYLCKQCKHAFVENMPNDFEINDYYRSSEIEVTEEYLYNYNNVLKEIKKNFFNLYFKKAKNILEIGPGSVGVSPLLENYQNYSIVEKSRSNVKNIQQRIGKSLSIYEDIQDIPYKINFDLILCFEVLEHLNNPKAFINYLENHFNNGAIGLFSVPNRYLEIPSILFENFRVKTAPGHLQFYSLDSLKILFSNFEIIQFNEKSNFYERNLSKMSSIYSLIYNNNRMIKSTKVNVKLFSLLFLDLFHKLFHRNRESNYYRKYIVVKAKNNENNDQE